MRITLIVNPVAGRRRGLRAAAQALPVLSGAGFEVDVHHTTGPGDAERLAREAAADRPDAVVVCGGDGSLSQAVRGLLDTGVPVGLIPAGTGNDFARAVGISREPRLAAAQLVGGRPAPVDLLETECGGVVALNVMGVGFDARVCERINRRRRIVSGKLAYLPAVARELIAYRPIEVRLRVDDRHWEGRILLLAVANAKSYGAGMMISPLSRIDDGLLDVVVVQALSRVEFIRSFPRVFRGTHLDHPAVLALRGREVEVLTEEPCPVLSDGDLMTVTPLRVHVLPGRSLLWLPGPKA